MSASMTELRDLHQAYTRLTDKFKTLWTFHQFLQSVHKTFIGDAPGYQVDFQSTYDQIKNVTSVMTFQPPAVVMDTINRLDLMLDQIQQKQSEDERKIAPNYIRRFFEKVRTEDEKLLVTLLRFYFSSRFLSHDTLDKMDFLITNVGARRSIDDGRFLVRFPQELQKLFGAFLALVRRTPPDPADVQKRVGELTAIRDEIDKCFKFEELAEKKLLERLRKTKHELGHAFFSVEVLSAMLDANLAAKNKFIALYEDEEQRILDSSRQLLELEKELGKSAKYHGQDIQEEFKKFRQYKEEFEKSQRDGAGVRHQEVTRLAESIDQLLSRLHLPQEGQKKVEIDDTDVRREIASAEAVEGAGAPILRTPVPGIAAPGERTSGHLTGDPLIGEQASKVLYSVEMIDAGGAPGKAAYGKAMGRLRLEPWEVRAARRLLNGELVNDPLRAREILFFEAAALRLRIDEEAQSLRGNSPDAPLAPDASEEKLAEAGLCLVRAQDMDRRFRAAIEEAAGNSPPEKLNELQRSRFRLLRAFSGLWLLHNLRAGI